MKSIKAILLACLLALAGAAAWADAADEMIRAIKQDNASRVTSLLRAGADPNTRDPRGVPGLYMALQEGSLEAARALIAAPRLDPNLRTPTDETALMMAALKGQVEIAQALITKGAQVNKPGWAPLHYAASGGGPEMIRLLLRQRAEVDARSPNESTPLMMAARYGTVESVQMLLRAGADPRARNQLGMDALDFAVSGERPDAIELLTQAKRRAPVRTAQPPAPVVPPPAARAAPPTPVPAAASAPAPVFSPASGPQPAPGQAVQITPDPRPGQAIQVTPAEAASAPTPSPPLKLNLPPAVRGGW